MEDLSRFSVKISNYKCFGEVEQGFEQLCPINIIIGRNNSGKSTLLEIIQRTTIGNVAFPEAQWHKSQRPRLILENALSERVIKSVFSPNVSRGVIPGRNHFQYGSAFIGTRLKWQLGSERSRNEFVYMEDCPRAMKPLDSINESAQYKTKLAQNMTNPISGRTFEHLLAERDISPEEDNESNLSVKKNGQGATNMIQNFINKVALPSGLVERTILDDLNSILGPDANFSDIVCQQAGKVWEIYLEEKSKGRVPLSHTGSGLKTIILVLIFIHLIPYVNKQELSTFIFAFEELENNVHPALLRRLLSYLKNVVIREHCLLFLTTHSNVIIDAFSKDADAQIVHLTHDGEEAFSRTVKTYFDNCGVLDDLDIRASDLLQSNGIIWVEGPSDRLYLNRWINLWSNGELQEGPHYQCIFYGGRLLAHLTGDNPEQARENWISILRANRNAIIVMDSDRTNPQTKINETKKRILEEVQKMDGMAWITEGKEIENYISAETVSKMYKGLSPRQVGKYEDFFDYLDEVKENEGKRFFKKKVVLAEKLCRFLTKDNLDGVLDLTNKIEEVCSRIKSWNGI